MWFAILLGAFAANYLTGGPLLATLIISIGNTFEAVVGATIIRWVQSHKNHLEYQTDVFAFILASILASLVSASMGAGGLYLTGLVPADMFNAVFLTWWVGDALGGLVVSPFLIRVRKESFYSKNWMAFLGTIGFMAYKTQGSFAYQAIAGMAFNIAAVPGLAMTAEYRFMGMTGNRNYGATVNPGGQTIGLKTNEQYNNAGLIGVRYTFGVRPVPVAAAPAPAPAPAPARSYLVFFDWDKANLTDRARQIIRDAADNSRKVTYTRLEVNGYTDTSGTPQYNQGLSVRRAQAVAAELVRDGVAKESISVSGFGDTKLLVATGPNVREPQNRRVEIVIR